MPSEPTRFRSESVGVEDQDLLTITEDLNLTSVHKDPHSLQKYWTGYDTPLAHDEVALKGVSEPLSQSLGAVAQPVPPASLVAMVASSAASSAPTDQQSEVDARQSTVPNESPPEKALYITGMGVVFVSFVNAVFNPPFIISSIAAIIGCGLGYQLFK
jgi:hypothetical protein